MLHPHRIDKESLFSQFPSGRFVPVRNVGCKHISYSSLQCSLWEHSCPHHPSPCLIIHSSWSSLHLPFYQLNYRSTQVSQELFGLLQSMHELQPDEDVWGQPTWFAPKSHSRHGRAEPAHWPWAINPLFETLKAKLRMSKFSQEIHMWKVILILFTLVFYPIPTAVSRK